jgi:hypothetical protein
MNEQQMTASRGLVAYLNKNVAEYKDKVPYAKVLYSMAGWSERYATDEHDCCAEDFAPKLMIVLEEVKQALAASDLDISNPGRVWYVDETHRSVMRNHGINIDFLEIYPDVEDATLAPDSVGQSTNNAVIPFTKLRSEPLKTKSLNWGQGLTRVSAMSWTFVAILSIGYTGLGLYFDHFQDGRNSIFLYLLLLVLAVVAPFGAHKGVCWVGKWLVDGFATKS